MAEKKEDQLPKTLAGIREKAQVYSDKLEKRLSTLTRRQLTILLAMIGFLTLLLGVALGYFLTLPRSTSSGTDTSSSNSQPETVSEAGVLRKLGTPQDGIEFYLEKEDGTQILLDVSNKFDSSFIQKIYEGTAVTIEGTLTKGTDGAKDILRVEKIVIKG